MSEKYVDFEETEPSVFWIFVEEKLENGTIERDLNEKEKKEIQEKITRMLASDLDCWNS